MLVVEHDAGKVAVHAIIEIEHVALDAQILVLDGAARDHIASNRESRAGVVTAGLSDDADRRREVVVESIRKDRCQLVEGVGREAAAHVEGVKFEAQRCCLIEDGARILYGLDEGARVRSARADVKSDACHVQPKLLRQLEEFNDVMTQ